MQWIWKCSDILLWPIERVVVWKILYRITPMWVIMCLDFKVNECPWCSWVRLNLCYHLKFREFEEFRPSVVDSYEILSGDSNGFRSSDIHIPFLIWLFNTKIKTSFLTCFMFWSHVCLWVSMASLSYAWSWWVHVSMRKLVSMHYVPHFDVYLVWVDYVLHEVNWWTYMLRRVIT